MLNTKENPNARQGDGVKNTLNVCEDRRRRGSSRQPNFDDVCDRARAVSVVDIVDQLGLTKARTRDKYACVDCDSSDALHIDSKHDRAKCYSCGSSWDAIGLWQHVHGVGFRAAVYELAGEPLPSAIPRPIRRAARKPPSLDIPKPDLGLGRRVRREIWEKFGRSHVIAVPEFVDESGEGRCGLSAKARAYLRGRGISPENVSAVSVEQAHWLRLPEHYSRVELEAAGLITSKGSLQAGWLAEFLLFGYFDTSGEFETFRARTIGRGKCLSMCGTSSQPSLPFGGYHLPRPMDGKTLFVVEGEIDALSIRQLGHHAIGIPGASCWRSEWCHDWGDGRRVVVLADGDEAGVRMARAIARSCVDVHGVDWVERCLTLRAFGTGKDANDELKAGALAGELQGVNHG